MSNLELAAQEYLQKRDQLGARLAAATVMQKFDVTSHQLSEYLRNHGLLLKQQAEAAVVAASEVHYLGVARRQAVRAASARFEDSRPASSIAAALERA